MSRSTVTSNFIVAAVTAVLCAVFWTGPAEETHLAETEARQKEKAAEQLRAESHRAEMDRIKESRESDERANREYRTRMIAEAVDAPAAAEVPQLYPLPQSYWDARLRYGPIVPIIAVEPQPMFAEPISHPLFVSNVNSFGFRSTFGRSRSFVSVNRFNRFAPRYSY